MGPGRTETARTNRTEQQGDDDINLAGPSWGNVLWQHPTRRSYRDDYREINPWIDEDNQDPKSGPKFSLASTFPHQVRFQRRSRDQRQRQRQEEDERFEQQQREQRERREREDREQYVSPRL